MPNLNLPLHHGIKGSDLLSAQGGQNITYTLEDNQQNLSLAFYKYVPYEIDNQLASENSAHKSAYLNSLARHWNNRTSAQAALWEDAARQFRIRQDALIESLEEDGWKIRQIRGETKGRFITGLGYDGPLEVGITLHPVHGFPYLPGTTVKGIARAYAELVAKADESVIRKIFGSPAKDPARAKEFRVGCVRFFDGLPAIFPQLTVDVMTVHFQKYYSSAKIPSDSDRPIPIPFLTIKNGQDFDFSAAARADTLPADDFIDADEAEACVALAMDWLEGGLAKLGAGAKTSSGYGYFVSSDDLSEEAFLALIDHALDEEELELEKLAAQRGTQEESGGEAAGAIEEVRTQKSLKPGYSSGIVVTVKTGRGKIRPADGSDDIWYRFEDAPGDFKPNKKDSVTYRIDNVDGQLRAVDVEVVR